MAIVLEANYSKKIGLPGYSSHQYSVTIRKELTDIAQVEAENARLYSLLQSCVDREIQEVGFLPTTNESNGHTNGNGSPRQNGNGNSDSWNCSDKQRTLILKIVEENRLDKNEVEALAKERFNRPVKSLNKLQASGLIDELLEKYGSKEASNGDGHTSNRRYGKGVQR